MKDLLLSVHVAVKTLNLEISRCHLANYIKEFYLNFEISRCHLAKYIKEFYLNFEISRCHLAKYIKEFYLNFEISRCHLANYVKEFYLSACRTCSTILFPHLTNQIIVLWHCLCRYRCLCLNS